MGVVAVTRGTDQLLHLERFLMSYMCQRRFRGKLLSKLVCSTSRLESLKDAKPGTQYVSSPKVDILEAKH